VGHFFNYSYWVENDHVRKGESVVLHIRVEGLGNFNFLTLPEPEYSGMILVDKKEIEDTRILSEGYEGFREVIMVFEISSEGAPEIRVPPFPWLNSETQSVMQKEGEVFSIIYRESSASEQEPEEVFEFIPKSGEEDLSKQKGEWYTEPLYYLLLLPAALVFAVLFFLKKKSIIIISLVALFFLPLNINGETDIGNGTFKHAVEQGLNAFNRKDYDSAEHFLNKALQEEPKNPSLLYNIGLLQYRRGHVGETVFTLRKSIHFAPHDAQVRELLSHVEEEWGLIRQVKPAFPIHPDVFFTALLICVNAACTAGILFFFKKQGLYAIMIILFLVFSAGSLIGLVVSGKERDVQTAVVASEDVFMKKIPKESASQWFSLPEGSTVDVSSKSEDYLLVETGDGIKGWLRRSDVLLFEGQ
jgi:tetratricopeptide (TPR) repeat protein